MYARTLLLDVLREEDIEDIEYVHLKEHALAGTGEVGSIQRSDSHKVIWIRYYVRPNIVTKENIDEGLKSLLNDMSSYWIEEKQLISLMRALRKEN